MHEFDDDQPDATGFEFTRRTVLKAGTAVGVSSTLAGCEEGSDGGSNATPTGTVDPIQNLVADGLEILGSELVESDGGWPDLGGSKAGTATGSSPTPTGGSAWSYVRVRVRNTLEDPISAVLVSAEMFDHDLEFVGVQTASISSLFAGEVFEGYIPYIYDDAAAYVLRVDRSSRPNQVAPVDDNVGVADDCLVDEKVTGTVFNSSGSSVNRLRVAVRFYDGDGNVLGTGTDTVTDLEQNEQTEFEVDLDSLVEDSVESVEEYSVSVGDYGGQSLFVR